MNNDFEISGHPHGAGLRVRSPNQYAMGLAIDVLEFLDRQINVSVKDTGWKHGFDLEVSASIPIKNK